MRVVRMFARLAVLAVCACVAFALSACTAVDPQKTIYVGASPTPHADILRAAQPALEEAGYDLEIIEFNDYIQPNLAVASGELDANFFQHITYLEDFNSEQGTNLVSAATTHFEPFGLYAGKTASLSALQDGATVAVPNDTTNEGRALALLQDAGLIKLRDGAGLEATALDITENPKNLRISEVEAAQLPLVLSDVDIAAINGNYALGAGLMPSDALALERDGSDASVAYANVLVALPDALEEPKIQALVEALTSDAVREYINQTYQGAVVPLF